MAEPIRGELMEAVGFDGRCRAIIESVTPEVDGGRFPIKRTIGETVTVEADVFADGHDQLAALLLHRFAGEESWQSVPMVHRGNDRWRGSFIVDRVGRHEYTVVAWVDGFRTWRHDLQRRNDPGDIELALQGGAQLLTDAAARAEPEAAGKLTDWAARLANGSDLDERLELALSPRVGRLMDHHPDRTRESRYPETLTVVVDRELARFGAWYEFFPRSCRDDAQHATLRDCDQRLAYVASMGFDIVYLPPIHPIGRSRRKGRNNTLIAAPDDPGSPWAIGAEEGDHRALHPQLGSMDDFRHFVAAANRQGLEVAIDIAFQASPDHPDVQRHPEWFRYRPDGSVQFAENPPKKYEDIYPFHFEGDAWESLWHALRDVFLFWADEGIRIFRVDNPHTKPFPFWEWVIGEVKARHPDALFLAEAFARPRIMYRLAKLGFSQSYTYFTWRNTKFEIQEYLHELQSSPVRDFFRPNFWPNTPDILPEYLQLGGRPAFMTRLVLAATLAPSYGIYGPAFELLERKPREPGSEEYLDSEKYELRQWTLDRPDSLRDFIARINRIRRDNPALHSNDNLQFHHIDNDELIAFSKASGDGANTILVIVNLDVHNPQSGWLNLPLESLGIATDYAFQAEDLISGARHLWHGHHNYVRLDPLRSPAHIFRLHRRIRSEHDFEYFM